MSDEDRLRAFGDALREARKTRGWTQRRLADEAGVNQTTISSWETGKKPPRSRDILERVERTLGPAVGPRGTLVALLYGTVPAIKPADPPSLYEILLEIRRLTALAESYMVDEVSRPLRPGPEEPPSALEAPGR